MRASTLGTGGEAGGCACRAGNAGLVAGGAGGGVGVARDDDGADSNRILKTSQKCVLAVCRRFECGF
eukprot:3731711-Prymnesium_polylepis.1